MKVLLACVNFNSYKDLYKYFESINISLKLVDNVNVDIIVADNSTERQNIDYYSNSKLNIKQEFFENIGYLPAAAAVINKCI